MTADRDRPPVPGRLGDQLAFLLEADRLKSVLRQCTLADGSRLESSAEHSWYVALMALVLAEHAAEPVDVGGVLTLAAVHDLVEVYAGDTFTYDEVAKATKAERERAAADRLFALLPDGQDKELRAHWEEYERGETAEARFAASVNQLSALLLNWASGGPAWRKHGITSDRVRARNAPIAEGAPVLHEAAEALIADAIERGILAR